MMIPGPVEVHPDVLKAMGSPVEPHYGDAWVEKNRRVLEMLATIFNTTGDVFLVLVRAPALLMPVLGAVCKAVSVF